MAEIINLQQWLEDHREYPCDLCGWEGIGDHEQPKMFPNIDLAYCRNCGLVYCKQCEFRHERECEFKKKSTVK